MIITPCANLSEREQGLLRALDLLYHNQVAPDILDERTRGQLYYIMYQVGIVTGDFLNAEQDPKYGEHTFNSPKVRLELKQKAVIELAFKHHLVSQHDEDFDEQFSYWHSVAISRIAAQQRIMRSASANDPHLNSLGQVAAWLGWI